MAAGKDRLFSIRADRGRPERGRLVRHSQVRGSNSVDDLSLPLDPFPVLWCAGRSCDECGYFLRQIVPPFETRREILWRCNKNCVHRKVGVYWTRAFRLFTSLAFGRRTPRWSRVNGLCENGDRFFVAHHCARQKNNLRASENWCML